MNSWEIGEYPSKDVCEMCGQLREGGIYYGGWLCHECREYVKAMRGTYLVSPAAAIETEQAINYWRERERKEMEWMERLAPADAWVWIREGEGEEWRI